MDALANVLIATRAGGTVTAQITARAPWGVAAPVLSGPAFHVVLSGVCWLLVEDEAPRQLAAGDVVVMPRFRDHALVSDPSRPAERVGPGSGVIDVPGPGAVTRFVCGTFDHDPELTHPLISLLPRTLIVSGGAAGNESLNDIVRLISREIDKDAPSASLAVDRLVDVLLILVVRTWILTREGQDASWLIALRDPHIARVLTLVHTRPQEDWTVSSLAREAGLSRATLARRFTELVGSTPAAYLTSWRMEIAAQRLRATALSLNDISAGAGYTSQAAFSRAFTQARGVAPGRYRHQASASAAQPQAR